MHVTRGPAKNNNNNSQFGVERHQDKISLPENELLIKREKKKKIGSISEVDCLQTWALIGMINTNQRVEWEIYRGKMENPMEWSPGD